MRFARHNDAFVKARNIVLKRILTITHIDFKFIKTDAQSFLLGNIAFKSGLRCRINERGMNFCTGNAGLIINVRGTSNLP